MKNMVGWDYHSVLECLASRRNTLGLTPSTNYKFNKKVLVNKGGE